MLDMTDVPNSLTLIVPGQSLAAHEPVAPKIVTQAVAIDAGLIRDNLDQCLAQLRQVFANLAEPAIEGWSVGTITVGLTVSAQGSVGIATAGIEAALEVSFKPNG
jgi:hypothetical protein